MSDHEQPDSHAVAELDHLVRHLAEELAAFRRRALTAEARLKDIESHDGGPMALDLSARITTLERENERLQRRVAEATLKARQMLERVRFLRQQARGGER